MHFLLTMRKFLVSLFIILLLFSIINVYLTNENGHLHSSILSKFIIHSPTTNINVAQSKVIDLKKFQLNPITKAYEVNGKPLLWQYWHSEDVPLYVRLLVEAMQCRNPEFHTILVHDSTIHHYLPNMNISAEMFQNLSRNHQSDIFRVFVMYLYGGAYADIDTFPLDKLYPWYRQLEHFDFVTANWESRVTAMGAFGPAKAKSRIFELWVKNQLKIMEEYMNRFHDLPWGVFGPYGFNDTINDVMTKKEPTYRLYDGYKTTGQLVNAGLANDQFHLPFQDVEKKFIPLRSTPFLMIHGGHMRRRYITINKTEELLPENTTLYSAFVGCALLDCWWKYEAMIEKNQDGLVDPHEIVQFLKRIDYGTCDKIGWRKLDGTSKVSG